MFYELQKLRVEDMLDKDDFEPDQWQQVEQFLDSGEVPKPIKLAKGQTTYVRKAVVDEEVVAGNRLLRCFTGMGYGIGILFLVVGLTHPKDDFLLRNEPLFYLGMFFCAAFCHAFVRKFTRSFAWGTEEEPEWKSLFARYFLGLLPMLGVIVLTEVAAGFIMHGTGVPQKEFVITGIEYMLAGAVVSLYVPFYFHAIAHENRPRKRKAYSLGWVVVPVLFVLLLILYFIPEQNTSVPALVRMRQTLISPKHTMADAEVASRFLLAVSGAPGGFGQGC